VDTVCDPKAAAVKIGPSDERPRRCSHAAKSFANVEYNARLFDWCTKRCPDYLTVQKNEIARADPKNIRERLGFLNNVGCGISDPCGRSKRQHLSGGEKPKRNPSCLRKIGFGAHGVIYVPSTNRPSACISATTTVCCKRLKNLRDQATQWMWLSNMTKAIRRGRCMSLISVRVPGVQWRAGRLGHGKAEEGGE